MRKLLLISTSFFVATSAFAQTPFGVNNGTVNLFPPTANSTVPFVSMPSQPNALQILQGNSNTATGAANAAMVAAPTGGLELPPSLRNKTGAATQKAVNNAVPQLNTGDLPTAQAQFHPNYNYHAYRQGFQGNTGTAVYGTGIDIQTVWANQGGATPDLDLHVLMPSSLTATTSQRTGAQFTRADQPFGTGPGPQHVSSDFYSVNYNGGIAARFGTEIGGGLSVPGATACTAGPNCETVRITGPIKGTILAQTHNFNNFNLTPAQANASYQTNVFLIGTAPSAAGRTFITSVTVGGVPVNLNTTGGTGWAYGGSVLTSTQKGPEIVIKTETAEVAHAVGVGERQAGKVTRKSGSSKLKQISTPTESPAQNSQARLQNDLPVLLLTSVASNHDDLIIGSKPLSSDKNWIVIDKTSDPASGLLAYTFKNDDEKRIAVVPQNSRPPYGIIATLLGHPALALFVSRNGNILDELVDWKNNVTNIGLGRASSQAESLLPILEKAQSNFPDYQIVCGGHSQGGIACANSVSQMPPDSNVRAVTLQTTSNGDIGGLNASAVTNYVSSGAGDVATIANRAFRRPYIGNAVPFGTYRYNYSPTEMVPGNFPESTAKISTLPRWDCVGWCSNPFTKHFVDEAVEEVKKYFQAPPERP